MRLFHFSGLIFICLCSSYIAFGQVKKGTVVTESLNSVILRENKVGLKEMRMIKIYLPPGYQTSGKSYPVVYYCHSIYGDPTFIMEGEGVVTRLMERAFANGLTKEFIFVVGDYSSPLVGS